MAASFTAVCANCNIDFKSYASRPQKYCSQQCYFKARDNDGRIIGETKRCAKCGIHKPFADFVKQPSGRAGLGSYCKPCAVVHQLQWKLANPNKYANPTTRPKRTAEERIEHKRAYFKEYRERNRDKVRLWNRLRHHKTRAAGKMPDRYDIGRMLCMQDARCSYCRELLSGKYHIDHKTPISRGGTNEQANLQLLCVPCNLKKGTKTDDEYKQFLRRSDGRASGND